MSIQVLHDTRPVARKRHNCYACNRVIEPGEKYWRQDNVGDDGRYTWKSCAHCEALLEWIYRTDPDVRYYDDGVDLNEWLIDYGNPAVLALFRRKWREPDSVVLVPVNRVRGIEAMR